MIAINETFGADPVIFSKEQLQEIADSMVRASLSGASARQVSEIMIDAIVKRVVEIGVAKLLDDITELIGDKAP